MDRRTLPPDARNRLTEILDRISLAITRRFEIDLRALAAFRIAIGTLLIVDLLMRSRDLVAFYTDSGVLPREALVSDYSDPVSLHALSGEAWVVALLFLVAGAFALAMIVGYRTRIATIVSWLLLLSLHVRNPMILNGGDVLLRVLLFWAIFLPLGERWAIDARRIDRDRSSVATVATIAVLVQMVVMYVTNAVHKTQGELWLNGEAVIYVFSLDQFTILLGNVLAEQYALLRVFTYLWIALVVLSPLLLLLTGVGRAIIASLFVGMHLGMLVTMRIDLFPLVVVAGLIPFYQTTVWDAAAALSSRVGFSNAVARRLERTEAIVAAVRIPEVPVPAAVGGIVRESDVDRGRRLFSTILPALFLALVLLSNAQAVGYAEVPDRGEQVLDATQTDQSWRMFAPDPLRTTRWFVAPGELADGSEVDALHGSEVVWDRPPDVADTYPNSRWRKYLSNVWTADNENHRSYLGNYLCGRWNGEHEPELETVTVYSLAQTAESPTELGPVRERRMHRHDCSGELRQSGDDVPRVTVSVGDEDDE